MIFSGKDVYINEQIDHNLSDSKKLLRNLNVLTGLGKNKKSAGMDEVYDEHGNLLKNQEAAEYMNDFYISAGPKLVNQIPNQWKESDFKQEIDSTFEFSFITEMMVKKLVGQIDISISAALGDLSSRLLKDAFACLTVELTYLYNSCLDSGTFPIKWGMGIVTPIPKTTSKSKQAKHWRPITQISLPWKFLERIVHTQLSSYLENNDILYTNQHGFRSDRSTSSAVFGILKTLFENWNKGLISTCVFIDFARAFDSIDHNIFVKKLKLYGMSKGSYRL